MGTDKNIKLHIVTDIKWQVIHFHVDYVKLNLSKGRPFSNKKMPTIISQIEHWEGRICDIEKRLHNIDVSLKDKDLPTQHREPLITEKEQLAAAIDDHQKNLKNLRHENRKTMVASVALLLIIISIYAAFNM